MLNHLIDCLPHSSVHTAHTQLPWMPISNIWTHHCKPKHMNVVGSSARERVKLMQVACDLFQRAEMDLMVL